MDENDTNLFKLIVQNPKFDLNTKFIYISIF